MKLFITFITSFRNFSFLALQYSTHFAPHRHLKLTRHTDIKFKRQKDGHFRRVTSQLRLPIFFFVTGKNGYGNVTNFCHFFDESETDRRQEGQQVTQFLEYGLMYNICAFLWPVAIVLRGQISPKKKVTN